MSELLKLDTVELRKELMNGQKKLMQLRFESRTGKLNAPHKIRLAKLLIARISTLLTRPEHKVVSKKVVKEVIAKKTKKSPVKVKKASK